jgi:DNA-binding GntR family transcriptional regulator
VKGRVRFNSLREQLFAVIREAILTNKYVPGEELQIDKLASEFGVSTTPVREALVRLEGVGLVRLTPNRGAQVTEITLEDVRDVWEVRRLLEPYAAKTAALNCSPEELDELQEKLEQVLAETDNFSAYMESDLALHDLLAKYVTNKELADIMDRVKEHSLRIRYFAEENSLKLRKEVIQQATREHLEIVAALRERDPAKVAQLVFGHLVSGEERTLEGVRSKGSNNT